METIKSATKNYLELQKLKAALETGNSERADPELAPGYRNLQAEMYISEGALPRLDRISPPEILHGKIIMVTHN